jgi:hypothetical protein
MAKPSACRECASCQKCARGKGTIGRRELVWLGAAGGLLLVAPSLRQAGAGAGLPSGGPARGRGSGGPSRTTADGNRADQDRPATATTARALLRHPRLELPSWAAQDLRDGLVRQELISLLGLLLEQHQLTVSVFKTRHSKYVQGSRSVSQHFYGAAVDIYKVDGQLVRRGNRHARAIVADLARLDGAQRPTEVGSPFPEFDQLKGWFSDEAHWDHLHLGVAREDKGSA